MRIAKIMSFDLIRAVRLMKRVGKRKVFMTEEGTKQDLKQSRAKIECIFSVPGLLLHVVKSAMTRRFLNPPLTRKCTMTNLS